MDWQPIETAPRDGTPVLTYMPGDRGGFVNVQTYRGFGDKWCNAGESKRRRLQQPTHWMPLPAPPNIPSPVTQESHSQRSKSGS